MGETLYLVDGTSALATATEAKGRGDEQPIRHVPGLDRVVQVEFTTTAGIQLDEAFYPSNPGLEPPYGNLTPVDDEEADSEASHDQALPPTTLDSQVVKEMLRDETGVDFEQRVGKLLTYAWKSSSIVERTIPSELYAYATDNLADWYSDNARKIKELIDERKGLIDIYDQTDEYVDRSPFLRNAISIHDTATNRGKRLEGLHIELGARLIVLDALERWNHSQDLGQ